MSHPGYDIVSGPLAVLRKAAVVPEDVAEACSRVFFGKAGDVMPQQTGEQVEIYSAIGTVPLHVDNDYESDDERFGCMGLVLVNECEACLTDGEAILPLPAGSVFRHVPGRKHGTCRPDGSQTAVGNFVFITYDFDTKYDEVDHPAQFADWALEEARRKLQELGFISSGAQARIA